MVNRSKFFKSCYNVTPRPLPESYDPKDVTPIISQDDVAVICPLNEFGLVSDVLQRALSSGLSESVRQSLLSLLDVTAGESSQFLNLPDEVKLDLVKLRSCQSPSEIHRYAEALNNWFETNNVKDTSPSTTSDTTSSPSNTTSDTTSTSSDGE